VRVLIDTNLWLSFIISKKNYQIEQLVIQNKIILLFSDKLLSEIDETINKPKLKKYFGNNALGIMLDSFAKHIELINVTSNIAICRDPKDNFLLNLAIDGKADYILTGDKDLLVLEHIGATKIVSFSEFIARAKDLEQ
jgi:putative PIN family toxin of toxin-antitoxin system